MIVIQNFSIKILFYCKYVMEIKIVSVSWCYNDWHFIRQGGYDVFIIKTKNILVRVANEKYI